MKRIGMVAKNDLIDFAFEVFSGHQKISSSGSPSQQGEILRRKRESPVCPPIPRKSAVVDRRPEDASQCA
jgi:hypothetical protein